MAIPESFIQDLLGRVDLVELIGRHVQLKKTGSNHVGLCPFHGEKTPSFNVSATKQFYHCFGCGKSGDAIDFLMQHNALDFVEAVRELASQCGMSVPDERTNPQDAQRAQARKQRQATLLDVLQQAAADYKKQLKANPQAVQYLQGRGLSGEVAARFALGYAPAGWTHLASVFPDYGSALLEESGLVVAQQPETQESAAAGTRARRYDRFRHRIIFPIRNVRGQCIGFGARALGDEKPKYLNSPETALFHKGHELYGLHEAREALRSQGCAIVTEGYMDVVALAQLGFANAVATLGTACTPEHLRKLFRYTSAIVFSFDGDAAGRRAAHKALQAALPLATDTRSIKFLFLPPEHDPDSFIRAHGAPAFAALLQQATPLSQYLCACAAQDCDLHSAEGRARMSSQAAPLWQALPQGALKQQLLATLAQHIQLGAPDLQALWGAAGSRKAAQPQGQRAPGSNTSYFARTPALRHGTRAQPMQRLQHMAHLLLTHMALWAELSEDDRSLLCAQAAPWGALFGWIDLQYMQHGVQPWSALRVALRGQPHEAQAQGIMQSALIAPEPDDSRAELQDALLRLHIERLHAQQTQASQSGDLARLELLHQELALIQQGLKELRASGDSKAP